MKRKNVLDVLALIMLVASLGAAQAFGGNFFGIDSESRDTIVNASKAKDYNCPNQNRHYPANAVAGAASFFTPNHHLTAAFG
jgi:hypothetical protein